MKKNKQESHDLSGSIDTLVTTIQEAIADGEKHQPGRGGVVMVTSILMELMTSHPDVLKTEDAKRGFGLWELHALLQKEARAKRDVYLGIHKKVLEAQDGGMSHKIGTAMKRMAKIVGSVARGDNELTSKILVGHIQEVLAYFPELVERTELQVAVSQAGSTRVLELQDVELNRDIPEGHPVATAEVREDWEAQKNAAQLISKQVKALQDDVKHPSTAWLSSVLIMDMLFTMFPHIVTTREYGRLVVEALRRVGHPAANTLSELGRIADTCNNDCENCSAHNELVSDGDDHDTDTPTDDIVGPPIGWAIPDNKPDSDT